MMHLKFKGDFCYVIWFDNELDATFFRNRLMKRGLFVMWHHIRNSGDWAVIWDIGLH